ncbi:hypothetical protein CDD82_4607 [Ophiocordyceps australis]|uniref:Uncharacterized protein n=1 Tax=Ophiocordyceps australis TaxID=1399860 RepID=A0A2C5Z5K5_9HYPO|nr:hypothetical protein CDD82_4607 [Ophiocordyceps australis]
MAAVYGPELYSAGVVWHPKTVTVSTTVTQTVSATVTERVTSLETQTRYTTQFETTTDFSTLTTSYPVTETYTKSCVPRQADPTPQGGWPVRRHYSDAHYSDLPLYCETVTTTRWETRTTTLAVTSVVTTVVPTTVQDNRTVTNTVTTPITLTTPTTLWQTTTFVRETTLTTSYPVTVTSDHTATTTLMTTALVTTVSTVVSSYPVVTSVTVPVTQTATQTATVTAPTTQLTTLTLPPQTLTLTQPGTTLISTLPATTLLSTLPPIIRTSTLPASTLTLTLPRTVLQPGPRTTVTAQGPVTTIVLPAQTKTLPASTVVSTLTLSLPAETVYFSQPGAIHTTVLPAQTSLLTTTVTIPPTTVLTPPRTTTSTLLTSITLCPLPTGAALPLSPTSDLTFGCKPGYVCNAPKPDGCNFWPEPPSPDFLCNPANCIIAPPYINVTWKDNETSYFPPTEGYFNLNPEAFGLSYDIFVYDTCIQVVNGSLTTLTTGNWESQTSLSEYPRSTSASYKSYNPNTHHSRRQLHHLAKRDKTYPATCYSTCNDVGLAGQSNGKNDALCRNGSPFRMALDSCQDCLKVHATDKTNPRSAQIPSFAQYLDYCSGSQAQPARQSQSAPDRVVNAEPTLVTTPQGPTSSEGFHSLQRSSFSTAPTSDQQQQDTSLIQPQSSARNLPQQRPTLGTDASTAPPSSSPTTVSIHTTISIDFGLSSSISPPSPTQQTGPSAPTRQGTQSSSVSRQTTVSLDLGIPSSGPRPASTPQTQTPQTQTPQTPAPSSSPNQVGSSPSRPVAPPETSNTQVMPSPPASTQASRNAPGSSNLGQPVSGGSMAPVLRLPPNVETKEAREAVKEEIKEAKEAREAREAVKEEIKE